MRRKEHGEVEHLALLSFKQGVYIPELFEALVEARKNGEAPCHNLTIRYRGSINRQAIFLVTKGCAIVGQFRLDEEFLLQTNIRFENWMQTDKIRRQLDRQRAEAIFTAIQDLRYGMKKVNLEAEVLRTSTPSTVSTQYGTRATVTNAVIADRTGSVKLCLWNEQALSVRKGYTIQIKNAKVLTYKGEKQLRLGKGGTVSIMNPTKQESVAKIS